MIKDIMNSNETILANVKQMEALKEYFPSCFREDGSFDIERFKDYLSDKVTISNEGYELKFLGKNYARLLASVDTTTVIVPDEEHNNKPENKDSQNIYISGDNLDGLKQLLKSYAHQIKCIYIDPPYNTGSDGFIYNDNFNFTATELASKLSIDDEQAQRILDLTKRGSASHSAWLMFMYPRLLLARDLLTDDGAIFISIDDNEFENLKFLCDDVFGESNFINTISVRTKASSGASGGGEDKRLKKNCEFVLWYARNKDRFIFTPPIEETNLMDFIEEHRKENVGFYYTRIIKKYGEKKLIGELKTGNGDDMQIYEHSNFEFSSISKVCREEGLSEEEAYLKYYNDIFMVTNAQTSLLTKVNEFINQKNKLISYVYTPTTGKSKGKLETKYVWNETLVVYLKDSSYLKNNHITKTEQIGTSWDSISWGRLDIEGNMPYKNGKKPTALIRQIINMVIEDHDIVLDFFSGSASTAHACMLESANGRNIQHISIQISEDLDKLYENGTKEKKKELKKIFDELDKANRPHKLDYVGIERICRSREQILESENRFDNLDLGFRHYILQEQQQGTLDKLESFVPEEQGMFLTNDILTDFGTQTVLTTWLVRDGYGFNADAEAIDFEGYTGYYIDKHLYLIDADITKEAIAAIVDKYETDGNFNAENVVLFGYSFVWTMTEELKINLARFKDTDKNLRINFDVRY